MKQFLFSFLAVCFFISCSTSKNDYNTIEYKEEDKALASMRNIRLFETTYKFLSNQTKPILSGIPPEEGEFVDTFRIPSSGLYILDLMTARTIVYLEKGGTIKLTVSGNSMMPSIKFEGDHMKVNEFILKSTKLVANQMEGINEHQFEQSSEDDVLDMVNKITINANKLYSDNKSSVDDSIIQFAKIENEAEIANFCLFYKYKINKFSGTYIPAIHIDSILKKFDGNRLESFRKSSAYRRTIYEFHKSNYNIESNENIDMKGFHQYLQRQHIHSDIIDYLLSMYATNYFITNYSTPEKAKEVYDYLMNVLKDEECRAYVYNAYLKIGANQ